MTAKNQRMLLIALALVAVGGAALLALSGLKDQAAFFYAPGDVKRLGLPLGRAVRLGGMVQAGSLKRQPDGVTIRFTVGDNTASLVPVSFRGVPPDLFREKSGVVAEGQFNLDGSFTATNLLAKHDERYMPPQMAGNLHETKTLKSDDLVRLSMYAREGGHPVWTPAFAGVHSFYARTLVIAEAGLAALWLAAAFAALQLALAALSLTRAGATADGPALFASVRPVAVVQGLLAAAAMALLITVFMRSDMSVALVAANSHSMKPWLYKFAGAWGNHEGSMLLWVTILGLAGGAVALLERRLDVRTLTATLGAQAAIALGFYAFLLFSSNPFARLFPVPEDGNGLNPLLQDPGLAFHPPTLYTGYVGLSVAFSFAVGALVTRDVGPAFARAMRPWVLGAWIFLTLGITAGSYWAYYELGWGGWWFWDPVENASLMPWLAATALLHSVTVLATRDGLRAWTIMLAVVAFSMSMIGTFLVRSGILTSVHAFAVDPERGAFILALLALYIGGALALFALRVGTVRQGTLFEPLSREGGLVANNLLLTVVLGIVLIGTLYPIVASAMGTQLSVGPPFFDKTAGPVALILVAVMAAGPLIRWRRDDAQVVLGRLTWPVVAAGAALAGALVFAPTIRWLPALGLTAAAGLAVASLAPLAGRNLRRTPLHIWGMVVAHFGIAVSLAGMASDSAFTEEKLVAVYAGQAQSVGPFTVVLEGIKPVVGDNWSALEAHLTIRRGDGEPFVLKPQSRYFANPVTTTNESAIATRWDGQLYTVLGQPQGGGRWQLRLWWKPFVTFIWLGGALIALGGALALLGRLWRERAR